MAAKSLMEQFVAFAAPAQPQVKANDPVAVFFAKIERQIALAREGREGKEINARVAWFKKDGTGYRVKIGREGLRFGEHQWFAAANLDEVIERLTMARQIIETSDALRKQIATISRARGERMKGSRRTKAETKPA